VHNIKYISAKYKKEIQTILELHRSGAGGIRIALALTRHRDELLQTLFRQIVSDTQHLAIIALGGYGRKELCFSSDTDILFLLADEEERSRLTPAVQEFLHGLLDAGLDVDRKSVV
jgi:[protein-PII] uridylyltransferase